MGNEYEFLSSEELRELRREMEQLAETNDDLSVERDKKAEQEAGEQPEILDILEDEGMEDTWEALPSIENNGS